MSDCPTVNFVLEDIKALREAADAAEAQGREVFQYAAKSDGVAREYLVSYARYLASFLDEAFGS